MAAVDEVRDGLEGVLAFASEIAEPDRDGGALRYRGVDIEELVGTVPFEGVWGLLVDGRPDRPLAPAGTHPLAFRTGDTRVDVQSAIAALAPEWGFGQLVDVSPEVARDQLARTASTTLSFVAQSARGGGVAPVPQSRIDEGRTLAERFLLRWRGEADPAAVALIDAYWITAAEHGMNASTFTARVVASTGADVAAALSAAVGALSGPLHGGAPARVLRMLDGVEASGDADAYVRDVLDRGERLMGFGHRIYRAEDPRARVLRGMAERLGSPRLDVARELERAALAALAQHKPDRVLATNVEFWSAVVLDHAAVPQSLFTPLFVCARTAGWSAHILEQRRTGRLIRPASLYVGTGAAPAVSIDGVSDAVDRLGTEEVARRLGVKRETVYAYVSRGLLERHPASGPHDSQFDPEEVERLAARARRPDRSSALEVVVETELTLLDPAGRLSYRGRDAIELARFRGFEEVVALLWDGAPPTPWGLDDERAAAVEALGTALGPDAPDSERIAAVVATLAARDPDRDSRDPTSVRRAGAEAFAGTLAALGRGRPDQPQARGGAPERTTAGVAERLWGALAEEGSKPRAEQVKALEAALILLADHELAASTFAARVAASAWAGPYRVILAGLGPLGGALHGGAGAAVEAMLDEVAAGADPGAMLDARLASAASGAAPNARRAPGPPPGFGHRVYRDRDPRADHILDRLGPDPLAAALLDAAAERDLPAPNVDFALAALVRSHGLRPGSAATIFTVARIAGIVAHALEEYEHRLRFRPRASYVGPAPPSRP